MLMRSRPASVKSTLKTPSGGGVMYHVFFRLRSRSNFNVVGRLQVLDGRAFLVCDLTNPCRCSMWRRLSLQSSGTCATYHFQLFFLRQHQPFYLRTSNLCHPPHQGPSTTTLSAKHARTESALCMSHSQSCLLVLGVCQVSILDTPIEEIMDSLTEEEFDTFLPNEEALRSLTVWATHQWLQIQWATSLRSLCDCRG